MSFARRSIRLFGGGAMACALGVGLLSAGNPASAASLTSGTQQAAVGSTICTVSTPLGQPATDSVKLNNVGGISFGTGGLDSHKNPICGGALQWNIPSTGINASLTGNMYMKGALGKTGRVLATYYDIHNNVLTGAISPEVTADSGYKEVPIIIDRLTDPNVYRVDVATQVLSNGSWLTDKMVSTYIGSANHGGTFCSIDGPKVELAGGAPLSGGHPTDKARCSWVVNANHVEAKVVGAQYFEDGVGREARFLLSSFDVHGTPMGGDIPIADNSPTSPGVVTFPVMGTGSNNDHIYKAQLVLQIKVGSVWETKGNVVTWYI